MPDAAMCMNKECKKRQQCYRYRAVPHPYWQAFAEFKPDENGECDYFWSVEGYPDNMLEEKD